LVGIRRSCDPPPVPLPLWTSIDGAGMRKRTPANTDESGYRIPPASTRRARPEREPPS
jgi:hypothetical protein